MEEQLKQFLNNFFQLVFENKIDFEIKNSSKKNQIVVLFKKTENNNKFLGRIIGKNKMNLKSLSRTVQIWFKAKFSRFALHFSIEKDGSETQK